MRGVAATVKRNQESATLATANTAISTGLASRHNSPAGWQEQLASALVFSLASTSFSSPSVPEPRASEERFTPEFFDRTCIFPEAGPKVFRTTTSVRPVGLFEGLSDQGVETSEGVKKHHSGGDRDSGEIGNADSREIDNAPPSTIKATACDHQCHVPFRHWKPRVALFMAEFFPPSLHDFAGHDIQESAAAAEVMVVEREQDKDSLHTDGPHRDILHTDSPHTDIAQDLVVMQQRGQPETRREDELLEHSKEDTDLGLESGHIVKAPPCTIKAGHALHASSDPGKPCLSPFMTEFSSPILHDSVCLYIQESATEVTDVERGNAGRESRSTSHFWMRGT